MKLAVNIRKNLIMAKILVETGERAYLGRLFQVSQPTIRKALNGQTNTELANKIRKAALARGGVVKNSSVKQ